MMHQIAHDIKRHNMEAIFLLRCGKTAEAIETFKSALRSLQSGLPDKAGYADFLEQERATLPLSSVPAVQSVSVVDNEEALAEHLGGSKQLFDLFPRAFEMWSPSCVASHQRCIVVLLYNMAVSLDAKAALIGDAGAAETWQASARQLYSSALEFASTHWDRDDMTAMRLVLLAVVNNLGRLQSLRNAFQETRFCVTLAMQLVSSRDETHEINREDFLKLGISVGPFYLLNQNILTIAPSA